MSRRRRRCLLREYRRVQGTISGGETRWTVMEECLRNYDRMCYEKGIRFPPFVCLDPLTFPAPISSQNLVIPTMKTTALLVQSNGHPAITPDQESSNWRCAERAQTERTHVPETRQRTWNFVLGASRLIPRCPSPDRAPAVPC